MFNPAAARNVAQHTTWWEYYGLAEHPFAAPAQGPSYFMPSDWEQHIDLMQLIIRHSHELLLLQGPKGCGKTTLLHQFIEQLEDGIPLCHLLGSPTLSSDELIEAMNGCFDLPRESNYGASVRIHLNNILQEIGQREQRSLLVIDNADQLPTPVLQAICYLQTQRWEMQAPLAIVLVIDNQFIDAFAKVGENYLDKTMLKSIGIAPFELHETEEYLSQRFKAAGLADNLPFSRDDLLHIQYMSGGIAAQINTTAEQLLQNSLTGDAADDEEEEEGFFQQYRHKMLASGLVFVILAAVFYLWQMRFHGYMPQEYAQNRWVEPPAPANNTHNAQAISTLARVFGGGSAPVQALAAWENSQQRVDSNVAIPAVDWQRVINPQVLAERIAGHLSVAVGDQLQIYHKLLDAEQVAAQTKAVVAPQQPVQRLVIPPKPALAKPVVQPQAMVAMAPLSHQKVAQKSAKQLKLAKQHADKKLLAKVKAAKALHVVAKNKIGKTAVAGLPKAGFTIQLMGVRHYSDIHHYLKAAAKRKEPVHFFKTKFNGKDWYVMVYGHYLSSEKAHQAMVKIPKHLLDNHTQPWVRSYSSVQQAIKHPIG